MKDSRNSPLKLIPPIESIEKRLAVVRAEERQLKVLLSTAKKLEKAKEPCSVGPK